MLQTAEFWIGLVKIVWINIILSGDNAVVIALAARSLPPDQQKKAVFFGSGAAVVLRIVLTVVAAKLLALPYPADRRRPACCCGSACSCCDDEDEDDGEGKEYGSLMVAVRTILIADLVMSLDNVIAVAAAAQGSIDAADPGPGDQHSAGDLRQHADDQADGALPDHHHARRGADRLGGRRNHRQRRRCCATCWRPIRGCTMRPLRPAPRSWCSWAVGAIRVRGLSRQHIESLGSPYGQLWRLHALRRRRSAGLGFRCADRSGPGSRQQRGRHRLRRGTRVWLFWPTAWAATTAARSRAAWRSRCCRRASAAGWPMPGRMRPARAVRRALQAGTDEANSAILEAGVANMQLQGMGTTLVLAAFGAAARRRRPHRRLALLPPAQRATRIAHARPLAAARATRRRRHHAGAGCAVAASQPGHARPGHRAPCRARDCTNTTCKPAIFSCYVRTA